MKIKDKKKLKEGLEKYKKLLKYIIKYFFREVTTFVVWGLSMFMVLIAVIGDVEDKLRVLDIYNNVMAFAIMIYGVVFYIIIIMSIAYLIMKLISKFGK